MAGPGLFGRLKLGLGSMLGDASAKTGQDALRRLDEAGRWLEFTFPEGASFRAGAEALGRHGGARAARARELLATLATAERDGRTRLADGYAHLEAGRAAEAAMAADRFEPIRQAAGAAFRELRELLEAHRGEQRAVWTRFAESEPIVRAGFLAGEVARLPEIPGLRRPDVGAFVGPYEEVLAAVPLEYQSGESDAIAFDPDLVGREVGAAAAAAPEAERRLTDWLYEAARGYEAALGREGAQRLLEELRNPERLRELRGQRPELFQPQPAMYGGMLGADLLPMLLMLSLFSSDGSVWLPSQTTAAGPWYGPPAPGEVGNWLERLGAPQGAELDSLVAMSEEPIDVEATEDGSANDALDDGADFDGGGD
jgi:hypothetical protein